MRKQQDYDEGENLTPNRIMELAENISNKAIKLDNWKLQTDEQKRIVALTAKVEGLVKSNKALKKKVKAKGQQGNTMTSTNTEKKTREATK